MISLCSSTTAHAHWRSSASRPVAVTAAQHPAALVSSYGSPPSAAVAAAAASAGAAGSTGGGPLGVMVSGHHEVGAEVVREGGQGSLEEGLGDGRGVRVGWVSASVNTTDPRLLPTAG